MFDLDIHFSYNHVLTFAQIYKILSKYNSFFIYFLFKIELFSIGYYEKTIYKNKYMLLLFQCIH